MSLYDSMRVIEPGVEPSSIVEWTRRTVIVNRQVLFRPPVVARSSDIDDLLDVLASSEAESTVALDLAVLPGLTAILAHNRSAWKRLALRVVAPTEGALEDATRREREHDAVVTAFSEALWVLQALGLPPSDARLAITIGETYWKRARFSSRTADGRSATVEIANRAGLDLRSSGRCSLRLLTSSGEADWWLGDDLRERIREARKGERNAPVREIDPVEAGRAILGPSSSDDPAVGRRPPTFEEYAPCLRAAMALAQEYLYGHTNDLRRWQQQRMVEALDRSDPIWGDSSVSAVADAGAEPTLLAGAASATLLSTPLARRLRVLLVRAPMPTPFGAGFPPLAIAQLGAIAKGIGAEVSLVDLAPAFVDTVDGKDSVVSLSALTDAESGERLRRAFGTTSGRFDVVGLSVPERAVRPFVERTVLPMLAALGGKVVLGGRGSGFYQPRSAGDGEQTVDFVVQGEGELVFAALLQCLASGKEPDGIPALWDTRRARTGYGLPVSTDLAALPPPDFHGLDLAAYRANTPFLQRPFLPLLFLRGCAQRCTFCADESARRPRSKPVQSVVNELRHLRDSHGVRDFFFLNNLINISPAWLSDFLDGMEREALAVRWLDCARVQPMDRPTLERMAAVGCVQLTYGVDQGSDRMLALTRKGFTVQQAFETIKATSQAGIAVVVNLIVGMPHETEEDFEAMRRFIGRTLPYVSDFSVIPYNFTNGSPLFNEPHLHGLTRRGSNLSVDDGPSWPEFQAVRDRRFRILAEQDLPGLKLLERGMFDY
jgi:pyruvate-formate lyase-activating enzyme